MSYQVSIEKCGSYDDHEVRKAIAACLAPLGGLESVVADGDHVLVKLNLLSAKSPDAAVTTHPAIVKATVELVQELGATPVLGDSPGGGSTAASYKALLEKTGQHLEAVIAVKPVIDVSNCKRCGECYRACLPNAIVLKKARIPDIEYSKCIRGYCCQELYPEGAITASAPLIRRLLKC